MPPKKYFDGDKLGPYNILMVRRTKRVGRKYYGLFICPFCSKEFESSIRNITAGTARSCGCYNKMLCQAKGHNNSKDIRGQKFNRLTAIEPTEKRRGRTIVWKCQCECGNECYVPISDLTNGHTKSCGCLRSYGEEKIANILTNNSIDFIREANFSTLVNQETGQRLRFDFLLPQYDIIIECNGLQHYRPINFFGGEEGYNKRHYLDDIKRQWAISNNYKVLEIKYKEDNDISETLILDFIKNNTKPAPQDL